nr:conserved phage C-terminal domain-containing protein [Lysinibacillus timonensis]
MKNKLLIPEAPLQLLPTLAVILGIKEAMILQQLHYRLLNSPYKKDGYTWYRHTYANWQKQFPFYSEKTISRAFLTLEQAKIIVSSQEYNPYKVMKTKWYRIDYEELYRKLDIPYDSVCQTIEDIHHRLSEASHCGGEDGEVDPCEDKQNRLVNDLKEGDSDNQATDPFITPHINEGQNDITNCTKEQPTASRFDFILEDNHGLLIKEEFKEELNKKNYLVEKTLDVTTKIIQYLNARTNQNYRVNNPSTIRFIKARLREGYQLEDFKRVIDVKVRQWLKDPKMKIYLRPKTLFNPTNFENYLVESREQQNTNKTREIKPIVLDFSLGEEE